MNIRGSHVDFRFRTATLLNTSLCRQVARSGQRHLPFDPLINILTIALLQEGCLVAPRVGFQLSAPMSCSNTRNPKNTGLLQYVLRLLQKMSVRRCSPIHIPWYLGVFLRKPLKDAGNRYVPHLRIASPQRDYCNFAMERTVAETRLWLYGWRKDSDFPFPYRL